MSILDASNASQGVVFTLVTDQFDFASQDPNGVNSATAYSWLTSASHDIQTRGTGMDFTDPTPDFGNVTEIDLDLGDNGTVDVGLRNITGLTGGGNVTAARLGVITDGVVDLFDELMSFDDDMIGSDFNDTFKAGGGDDIIAVFRERHDFKPGDKIRLKPDPRLAHLFDEPSGKRLNA